MGTKEYLNQIGRLDRMIQNKLSEIRQIKDMAISITVAPKEVNVQTSGSKDRMGDTVAKLVDLESETDKLVDEYMDKRKLIIEQIDGMGDTNMYHVLSQRYVMKKELGTIAIEMGYSFKQVRRIHGNALAEFERIYGDEYLEDSPKVVH